MQNRVGDAVRTPHAVALANDVAIVIAPSDEVCLRWHGRPQRKELRGQLRAALAAASCNDCAAGAGAHACAEAVHLGAAAVVGLKSTLAHKKLREICACGTGKSMVGRLCAHTRERVYAHCGSESKTACVIADYGRPQEHRADSLRCVSMIVVRWGERFQLACGQICD